MSTSARHGSSSMPRLLDVADVPALFDGLKASIVLGLSIVRSKSTPCGDLRETEIDRLPLHGKYSAMEESTR